MRELRRGFKRDAVLWKSKEADYISIPLIRMARRCCFQFDFLMLLEVKCKDF
jgi:hypothetical protein